MKFDRDILMISMVEQVTVSEKEPTLLLNLFMIKPFAYYLISGL